MTCTPSLPSSSAPATFACAPRSGRCHRRCVPAMRSRRPVAGDGRSRARSPAPGRAALRRRRRRDPRRHRPPWPTGSIRAPHRAARAVGRVDAHRRRAGGLRGTVAGLRPRLAAARALAGPASTVSAIGAARQRDARVVALGTTVARALEHAAAQPGALAAGLGLANNRLGATTRLAIVDVLVSARTSRARATTRCCAHSSPMRRWRASTPRSNQLAIAATSSATRS
ncbi:MAG TPA: S-adenosylmethionine:tRNA ribosyltransferase-isomerase [Caldimonas sp.]